MSFAEIKRFYPEGKIRYASTLVDDLGKNYDNTRPGVIFDLHFSFFKKVLFRRVLCGSRQKRQARRRAQCHARPPVT